MNIWSSLRSRFAPPPPPVQERTPEPAPAPVPEQQTPIPSRIPRPELGSEEMSYLMAMGRQVRGEADTRNPFDASGLKPPPGFKGAPGMAMDEVAGVSQWAVEGIGGVLGRREEFIGFPELALLAQIPEYRQPVEIIATEATRKWIKFSMGGTDKSAKIAKIEAEFKRLNVQGAFREISEHDGFYGRGHLFIDVGADLNDRDELIKPIGTGADGMSKLKIGKGALKALRAVEPVWVWPNMYNSIDPLSPKWYRPETWFCMAKEVHKNSVADVHCARSPGPSKAGLYVRRPEFDSADTAGG